MGDAYRTLSDAPGRRSSHLLLQSQVLFCVSCVVRWEIAGARVWTSRPGSQLLSLSLLSLSSWWQGVGVELGLESGSKDDIVELRQYDRV